MPRKTTELPPDLLKWIEAERKKQQPPMKISPFIARLLYRMKELVEKKEVEL